MGKSTIIAAKEKSTSSEQSKDVMDVKDSKKIVGKEDAMDVEDSTETDRKEDAMEIEDSAKNDDGKTASTNSSDGHENPGKSVGEKFVPSESGSTQDPIA